MEFWFGQAAGLSHCRFTQQAGHRTGSRAKVHHLKAHPSDFTEALYHKGSKSSQTPLALETEDSNALSLGTDHTGSTAMGNT